jgi:hypothetical protein
VSIGSKPPALFFAAAGRPDFFAVTAKEKSARLVLPWF